MLLAMKVLMPRKRRNLFKNIASILGVFLPFPVKKKILFIDKLCQIHDFEKTKYVGNLMSTYRKKEIMEKEIYGTPTKYTFEGLVIFGPEKKEEYLTHIYGNWRKLPDEKQRESEHDFLDVKLNLGWKE
jgi:lipopolysaccharide cholinephosphotransferase